MKVISFAELLEHQNKTQIKTYTKKSAYFKHPDFSAAKIEKCVQITRANTVILAEVRAN